VDELIGTGVVKFACCHPDAVSFVKVVVASNVPVLDQRFPTWVSVLASDL
jgi:hypothetical protein